MLFMFLFKTKMKRNEKKLYNTDADFRKNGEHEEVFSMSHSEGEGPIYTVPMNENDQFKGDLLDKVATNDVVLNDIIDHMATPMGPDDDSLSVEMMEQPKGNEGGL